LWTQSSSVLHADLPKGPRAAALYLGQKKKKKKRRLEKDLEEIRTRVPENIKPTCSLYHAYGYIQTHKYAYGHTRWENTQNRATAKKIAETDAIKKKKKKPRKAVNTSKEEIRVKYPDDTSKTYSYFTCVLYSCFYSFFFFFFFFYALLLFFIVLHFLEKDMLVS